MTPRELEAHSRVAVERRDFAASLYAGIQSTLHNAHFKSPGKKGFTPAMFLSTSKSEVSDIPQWKRDLEHSRSALMLAKRHDPNSPEAKQTVSQSQDRAARAKAAKERGEPREVIERIMTGVA